MVLKDDNVQNSLKDEYFNLQTANKITTRELTKAKEFLKGRLILELEDSRAMASIFATSELLENKIR